MGHHQQRRHHLLVKVFKSVLALGLLICLPAWAQRPEVPRPPNKAPIAPASERPPSLIFDEVGSFTRSDKGLLNTTIQFGKPKSFHLTILNLSTKNESEARAKAKEYQEKSKQRFRKGPDRAQVSIVVYNNLENILVESQGEIPAHIEDVWIPTLLMEYKTKKQRVAFFINEQILKLNREETMLVELQKQRSEVPGWVWGLIGLTIGVAATYGVFHFRARRQFANQKKREK